MSGDTNRTSRPESRDEHGAASTLRRIEKLATEGSIRPEAALEEIESLAVGYRLAAKDAGEPLDDSGYPGLSNLMHAAVVAAASQLALALRTQADALVNGDFVTGLERINLLYEAANYIDGGSSSSLTPGAGDATQGAKDAEPGTASESPPPESKLRVGYKELVEAYRRMMRHG